MDRRFLLAVLVMWASVLLSGCETEAAKSDAKRAATSDSCVHSWPEAEKSGTWHEVVTTCRKEAEEGDVTAQFLLAFMYRFGAGVSEDSAEAARWLRKAAEQGHPGSQNLLGGMYKDGDGVPHDDVEAVNWFRKAAQQGHAGGQHSLGVMYAKGQGVPRDRIKAHALFDIAVAHGHGETYADAVRDLDIISGKMTADEISEARQLAGACAEKDYKECGF